MTSENPSAPQPVAQYHQQNPYQSVPARPPLTRELKRASAVAGAVGFTLMSIGWSLFSGAALIGLFAGLIAFVMAIVRSSMARPDAGLTQIEEFIGSVDLTPWVALLVAVGILGAALWLSSLFISRGILRRAGHPSPWGVTWAGAGIAVAASFVLSGAAWVPMQMIGAVAPIRSLDENVVAMLLLAAVAVVISIASTVVTGWLSWWWMAHVMRPKAAAAQ